MLPKRPVPSATIWDEFNRRHLARIRDRTYTEVIKRDVAKTDDYCIRHDFPKGTRAQIVTYFDRAGRTVAVVHRFVKPDGTLAASGLPDPKLILVDDEYWFCQEDA